MFVSILYIVCVIVSKPFQDISIFLYELGEYMCDLYERFHTNLLHYCFRATFTFFSTIFYFGLLEFIWWVNVKKLIIVLEIGGYQATITKTMKKKQTKTKRYYQENRVGKGGVKKKVT